MLFALVAVAGILVASKVFAPAAAQAAQDPAPAPDPLAPVYDFSGIVPVPIATPAPLDMADWSDAWDYTGVLVDASQEGADWENYGGDGAQLDVLGTATEVGKSVIRGTVNALDPLAAITNAIPGVPTFGLGDLIKLF